MAKLRSILLAEDDELDAELTIDALRAVGIKNPIQRVADGAEALDFLYRRGAYAERHEGAPLVVILDIKMPRVDGHEVLEKIRADALLKHTPVVMLTSSRHESDMARDWGAGVNAYVVKPVSPAQYTEAVQTLGQFWATINQAPGEDG
jgi:two-component system response regulator